MWKYDDNEILTKTIIRSFRESEKVKEHFFHMESGNFVKVVYCSIQEACTSIRIH